MNRRETLKALAISTIGTGAILTGCDPVDKTKAAETSGAAAELFGQTPEEIERNRKIAAEKFLTAAELSTITVLGDWIIPKDEKSGSASDAGVPAFIDFIVKDQPRLQTPIRGGLRWIDMKAANMYGTSFTGSSKEQQQVILDLIAYPEDVLPENKQGAAFFTQLRNLVAMGFFSSKMGIEDMGYQGNKPNAWDGVPEDVLKQYNLAYDEQTLKECLKIEDRGKIMEWPA
ncbi:gluconate 2-dehydrogenase subunit 3 family protein [Pollutibacter soli]|uniref:gluconate 2-dehydrogenase subunit 3 family protein n=1 Tax=Pollutibacter soli TaxID=3034157 RepID=UPI003013E039